MFRSYKFKNSIEKCRKIPGRRCFAVRKEWVNVRWGLHNAAKKRSIPFPRTLYVDLARGPEPDAVVHVAVVRAEALLDEVEADDAQQAVDLRRAVERGVALPPDERDVAGVCVGLAGQHDLVVRVVLEYRALGLVCNER